MRFTTKLVIGLFAAIALAVGAVAAASWWSFEQGFSTYLAKIDSQDVAPLAKALTRDYARHGSWAFVRRDPDVWRGLVAELFSGRVTTRVRNERRADGPPGLAGRAFMRARGPRRRPLFDPTGLHSRLRLLDADHHRIAGPPDEHGNARLEALKMDGKTIGWLSIDPLPLSANRVGTAFRARQLHAFVWIAFGMLLLTPLLAYGLGRYLLSPLRRLAGATNALAAGDYAMRVPVATDDELGRLAADFNELATALERNERLRREAMADVSHELRTPISLLRAEIEAMQDGVRRCDAQRLASLHATVQGLSGLVEDLYQLTLADAQALTYHKQPCDLRELLRESAQGAEDALVANGLALEIDLPVPLPVIADPRRLRQLFDNLLKNSIRYTERGGQVVLRGRQERCRVLVAVFDSAPGVDAASLHRLFERFYRVEKSRSRARGGAGLGLAICKSIAEAHDGTIEAKPSPLGGVSIVTNLPAANSTGGD